MVGELLGYPHAHRSRATLGTLIVLMFALVRSISNERSQGKDGEGNIEASLRRIEEHLGTLPASAPSDPGEEWKLPATPLEAHDASAATS